MLTAMAENQDSASKRRTGGGRERWCNEDPRSAGKRDPIVDGAQARNVRPVESSPRREAARTGAEAAERVESRLASRQEGSVKRFQLIAAGVSPHTIDRQVRAGALHREHRGVYIVGHMALAPMAREAAALLACGRDGVISHRSAAYLWGLLDAPPGEVHVTLVGRRCRPKRGVKIRTVACLTDVRRKRGVCLTSPARTIVDLAADTDDHELERLIARAREKRLLREGELEAALARAGKRRGVARLRALLRTEAGQAMTRSEVERRCRRLLEAARLPQPKVNRRIAGYEVDFLWPEQRVILEVDTITFHGHRRAFEWDRHKTMALEDAGYHVIRVTRRQLAEDPYWVIAHIARALDRYTPAAGIHPNISVRPPAPCKER